jgi:2-polyprenyl-6-methoxyphenol hydroxylase-like FAD-dependent oxidoreductase
VTDVSAGEKCGVLIVGAGPTGLTLALSLARLGIPVRVIDKVAEPGTTSRALVVHARILEQYRQHRIADEVVERGLKMEAVNLWAAGKQAARLRFGDLGTGLSPYPYALIFPQDEHERFLIAKLEAAGVRVERPVELAGFTDAGDRVRATLRHPDGSEETSEASYLAGCDGAHSMVRETLAAGFPGGTYEHMFYVADVEATGPVMNRELHGALDKADFLAVFPLKEQGRARLIGTVRDDAVAAHGKHLAWEDVSTSVLERMRIEVKKVHWFSTYHVHHRVAPFFSAGRAFLLGDAAHIHSPVGGQGMNTGIGDAFNLAWKLAAVIRGRAAEALLRTYEPERRAFALRLVASTDRAVTFNTHDGPLARLVRLHVVPRVLPLIFSLPAGRRLMFRTISQIGVHYRASELSEGAAGRVKAGDRLPWVAEAGSAGNFVPLDALAWQLHVYGEASADVAAACARRNLALHRFSWRPPMSDAGLARDALYLVRPDGYVGFAAAPASIAALEAYLDARAIRP